MTLIGGTISDSSGAISFDDENLSTTGTFSSGQITTNAVLNITTAVSSGTVDLALVEGTADSFETTIDNETIPLGQELIYPI